MSDLNRSTTPRGFGIYDEFTDTYGAKVRVQQSSSAEGSRCWIFAGHGTDDIRERLSPSDRARLAGLNDAEIAELAVRLTPSPHLDVEQAKRVRDALDVFIRESEAEEE